jgi:hypothetical protein
MSLDRVRRVARALAPELDQMIGQMQARVAGHDDVVFDKLAQSVLYTKEGRVLWRAHFELIGRFSRDLGLFRWWWVGRPTVGETRMDTAYGEAQRLDLQALLDKQVVIEDIEDARHLARLAAHFAGADGVIEREEAREGDDLNLAFYALFDAWHGSDARQKSFNSLHAVSRTMPPPAVIPAAPRVPVLSRPATAPEVPIARARSSAPPQQQDARPPQVAPPPNAKMPSHAPPRPVREPAAALLSSLVPAVAQAISASGHLGFRQALLVVAIDTQGEKARFFAQVVVQNERGDLEAVETSRTLLDAVARFIADDARSGNGRWRRLSVRFARGANGLPALENTSVTG